MTLTATQIANTTAGYSAAEYAWFAGGPFYQLLQAGINTLSGWTAPTVGKPSGYTEISSRVSRTLNTTATLEGRSVTWDVSVQGENYDAAYLGIGLTLVWFRRLWRDVAINGDPAGWQPWQRFLGEIVSQEDTDNYAHGQAWRRTVTGASHIMERINAPRLTLGPVEVATGASVEVLDTIAAGQLNEEANRGEFTGTVADVSASNLTDGSASTVWISSSVPNRGTTYPAWSERIYPTEIFVTPLAGWPSSLWWIELYNSDTHDQELSLTDQDGDQLKHPYDGKWGIPRRSAVIVCGNRAVFEAYTGGAQGAFIIDASEFNANFRPHPTDGSISVDDLGQESAIAWAPGGASRTYPHWSGATFNSTGLQPGYSIQRINLDNGWIGGDPANWALEQYPTPGGYGQNSTYTDVWLILTLDANKQQLVGAHDQTSTQINLSATTGFLSSGKGIVDNWVFTYTAKTGAALTGVTWDVGGAHSHANGADVYPYVAGIESGAWPITATHLHRRKQPVPLRYKVFFSDLSSVRNNRTIGWFNDYYAPGLAVDWNSALVSNDTCNDATHPYRWVRSVMYVIEAMSTPNTRLALPYTAGATTMILQNAADWPSGGDAGALVSGQWDLFTYTGRSGNTLTGVSGLAVNVPANATVSSWELGRTKINEITADLYEAAATWTNVPGPDGAESNQLAAWLWTNWLTLDSADLVANTTAGSHRIGTHSLAVTAMYSVFDDLARMTGCMVDYGTDGKVYWQNDPRWPLTYIEWLYTFDAASIRGDVVLRDEARSLDYVIANCQVISGGKNLPRTVRAVYPPLPLGWTEPPAGSQSEEDNGGVIPADGMAQYVAAMRYRERVNRKQITFTVKGLGEWCWPGQRIALAWDLNGDGVTETYLGIILSVGRQEDKETWRTEIDMQVWG